MQVQRLNELGTATKIDIPYLILRRDFFAMMFDPLMKIYGSAGASMIYAMGKDSGESEVRQFVEDNKEYAPRITKRELLDRVFQRFNQMGWGGIVVEEFDGINKKVRIIVNQNPFIDKFKSELNGGIFFLRGLLVGITSEVLEEELSLSDPRCLESSKGFCELNIVSKDQDFE